VTVLGYENAVSPLTLTMSISTPGPCQTTDYLAGANETAIMSVDVTGLPSSDSTLWLAPMYTLNGGAAQFAVSFLTAGPLNTLAWGSLHNQAALNLTAGVTYRFKTGVRAESSVPMDQFSCRGLVTIVKRP
jgi:hypothetical protein